MARTLNWRERYFNISALLNNNLGILPFFVNFYIPAIRKSTLFPYICRYKLSTERRMSKYPLLGMTLVELQSLTKRLGMPGFAAKQIASWLYEKKVASIDDMTNLSLKHRELLKQNYEVGAEAPVDEMRSVDGTVKYLYKVGENHFVESVYIPDDDRATLCVSILQKVKVLPPHYSVVYQG